MSKIMVVKRFEFHAAHYLPGYLGPCRELHGHSYILEVGVSAQVDAKTGMVIDFKALKDLVKLWVVNKLDHSCLNEMKCTDGEPKGGLKDFPFQNPTAEEMVAWMVGVLRPALFPTGADLAMIRLWETSGSYAEWRV